MKTAVLAALGTMAVALAATPAAAQTDSLTLSAALAYARRASPVLAAASAAIQTVDGELSAARSQRLPRGSVDALYLRFQDPPGLALGPVGTFTPIPQDGYFVQFGVRQPVYTGGRLRAAIDAVEWARRGTVATREQVDVELTAAVAHAHDAALLARSLADVAGESVRVLEAATGVAKEMLAAGAAAQIDVIRAETRLASAHAQLRAAHDAVATASERLAVAIGMDPAAALPASGTLEPATLVFDSAAAATAVARLHSSRPDLRALNASAQAALSQGMLARASLRPTVAVYVSALAAQPELLTERNRWGTELYAGAIVSWPIYDFGEAAGRAARARGEAGRLDAEAERIRFEAAASLRAHTRDLRRASDDMEAWRENVCRAEAALAIAQERYVEGVGIQLEVFEAQAELARVRAELLRSIHDHRFAAVELRRAAGLPADAHHDTALQIAREEP